MASQISMQRPPVRAVVHRLTGAVLAVTLAAVLWSMLGPGPLLAQEGMTGVVVSDSMRLNLRSGPGSAFPVLAKLEPGAVVTILAEDESGEWVQLTAEGVEGWAASAYIAVQGESAAVTATPGVTPAAPLGALARAAGRSSATATARAIAPATSLLLPTPTPATAVARAATAAPTAAPTVEPTVEPTIEPDGELATETADLSVPVAIVVAERMNVRGGPGTNYAPVASAAAGERLEITASNAAADWYRVLLPDGGEGWVAAALVRTAGPMEGVPALADSELPAPPVALTAPPSASTGVAVTSAPLPSGSGGFGFGITASMWQGDKAGSAAAVQDLGFGWVKQQVRWEFVETAPGAVNWQEMDDIVNIMNGYGVNVAFSIVTAPGWTRPTKGGTNGPPEDFQLFANFVGAVAGRYCGQSLRAIEVWNEQNLRREWEGYPLDPALYMDLLSRSYASIKAACPSMIVISGATTPAGYSDVAFDDIDYLRGMYQNGLARYSDAVGIHPSGFANPPGVRFSDWQAGAYTALSHADHRSFYFLSTLEESRAVMQQYGDSGKKLWPTEFGWGSAAQPYPGYEYQARISEQQQADWIAEAYRIMGNSGYVGVAFLWNLNYNYGEMQTFSIMGRPAYQALKALTGR